MNNKELLEQVLEQAEQRIAEVENIKKLVSNVNTLTMMISEIQKPQNDIYVGELMEETNISGAIGSELKIRLKTAIVVNMEYFMSEKNKELEKLLGIRKPAIINPEFEKDVLEMENQKKPDSVEEKLTEILQAEAKKIDGRVKNPSIVVEDVRRMYQDEGKTMTEIAAYYGVKKTSINNLIYLHHLSRKQTPKNNGFLDAKVQAR